MPIASRDCPDNCYSRRVIEATLRVLFGCILHLRMNGAIPLTELGMAPSPKASVSAVRVGGRTTILDCASLQLCVLSPVGTVIWECFDGSTSIGDIASDFACELGGKQSEVKHIVIEFCRDLAVLGFLDGVSALRTPAGAAKRANDAIAPYTLVDPPSV